VQDPGLPRAALGLRWLGASSHLWTRSGVLLPHTMGVNTSAQILRETSKSKGKRNGCCSEVAYLGPCPLPLALRSAGADWFPVSSLIYPGAGSQPCRVLQTAELLATCCLVGQSATSSSDNSSGFPSASPETEKYFPWFSPDSDLSSFIFAS